MRGAARARAAIRCGDPDAPDLSHGARARRRSREAPGGVTAGRRAAGVVDQGQISKLLRALRVLGLPQHGRGSREGRAQRLGVDGLRVRRIRVHTHEQAVRGESAAICKPCEEGAGREGFQVWVGLVAVRWFVCWSWGVGWRWLCLRALAMAKVKKRGSSRSPHGIAVEQESGDVYVADSENNRVEKFGGGGEFLFGGVGVSRMGITEAPQRCTTSCFAGIGGRVPASSANRWVWRWTTIR